MVHIRPAPSVIVLYVFVKPPVDDGKDEEGRRVQVRGDVCEGLCWKTKERIRCIC